MDNEPLALFVYGTLKTGFPAHEIFFDARLEAEEGFVRGSLFGDFEVGFPALSIPDTDILAVGTTNPASDVETQRDAPTATRNPPAPEERVHGEIFRIEKLDTLSALDAFEGFRAGGESLYERVLIPAWKNSGEAVFVWAYVMDEPRGDRIPGGVWRPHGG